MVHPATSNGSANSDTHYYTGDPVFCDSTCNDMLSISERCHKFQPRMKLTKWFFFFLEMVVLASILVSFSVKCHLRTWSGLQKSYYKCRTLLLETTGPMQWETEVIQIL